MDIHDEIVNEIRANRDRHAAQFNYDLKAIFEDFKKSERGHRDRLAKLKPARRKMPVPAR